jgi:hypothetical protein
MGVVCADRIFELSRPCPTRPAGPRNRLIRKAAGGHLCSLIVRGCEDSCTGPPGEVRHGAA